MILDWKFARFFLRHAARHSTFGSTAPPGRFTLATEESCPQNVEGLNASDKASIVSDSRNRDTLVQQNDGAFAGSFMSGQSMQTAATDQANENTSGFQVERTANLQSVTQTNLPEPYSAVDPENLKEGLPEGLSDTVLDGPPTRWAMGDRLSYRERWDE